MSTYSWTLPASAAGVSGLSDAGRASQFDALWGKDIWFDVRQGEGDYEVTAAGDWLAVGGEEALRQAMVLRIITDPGEWQTLPEFGVGARMFVRARNTQATWDELVQRIRGQLAQDPRVAAVAAVEIDAETPGVLRIGVSVIPVGRSQENSVVRASVEVT